MIGDLQASIPLLCLVRHRREDVRLAETRRSIDEKWIVGGPRGISRPASRRGHEPIGWANDERVENEFRIALDHAHGVGGEETPLAPTAPLLSLAHRDPSANSGGSGD